MAADALWALQTSALHLLGQKSDIPKFEISRKGVAYEFGVLINDRQAPTIRLIAKRDRAPHPHAFRLRRCNLVANPLGRDLSLELGKGEKHVQCQAAQPAAFTQTPMLANQPQSNGMSG